MILAIDQGTTGTTCIVFDDELRSRGRGYREIRQYFPNPGWVEHDPDEIWTSVLATAETALARAGVSARELRAIGITNQRETTVVWDKRSGTPVHPAIVWQDRRTAARCRELPADLIRERTGLVPDPYFSATKLEWILGHLDRSHDDLAFGTVDSWLVYKLTGGAVHATDLTNASRTLLFDLERLEWSDELLELFGIERSLLPDIRRSSEVIGEAQLFETAVPITGIAGDQQAALFGHACFAAGQGKATYGTGSFVLVNVGEELPEPHSGVLATVAASSPPSLQYALEGAVLVSGAAIQWLRDGLGVLEAAEQSEELARSVASSGGVVFVPALTGLGSPYWDPDARGLICGITRGTTRAHLARAALEAIAFQIADVADALPNRLELLRADGGGTANGFLMQFQADVLGCPIEVASELETTAVGAAALAGLATGLWAGLDDVAALITPGRRYEPQVSDVAASGLRDGWRLAVARTRLTDVPQHY